MALVQPLQIHFIQPHANFVNYKAEGSSSNQKIATGLEILIQKEGEFSQLFILFTLCDLIIKLTKTELKING